MSSITTRLGWLLFATLGAFAFAYVALNRGESVGAIWIVIATVCVYTIATVQRDICECKGAPALQITAIRAG